MRKEEAWKEECLEEVEVTIGPGATAVSEETERIRLADRKRRNANYFLEAAEHQLQGGTPLAALVLGYFAVESMAEAAIALHGYKVETHPCTIKGVSRVLEEPEIATQMNALYEARKNVNYEARLDEEDPERAEEKLEDMEEVFDMLAGIVEDAR